MRPVQQLHYHDTYWYAGVVRDVLHDRFSYLSELEGFHCDGKFLALTAPFSKWSALHSLIEYVVDYHLRSQEDRLLLEHRQAQFDRMSRVLGDGTKRSRPGVPSFLGVEPQTLPVEWTLRHYHVEHETFFEQLISNGRTFGDATDDDLERYYDELWLSEEYEVLLEKITLEVFYILFQNRELLLSFNDWVASMIAGVDPANVDERYSRYFDSRGRLRRVAPPRWARRAVFYRDHGVCALCRTDLTGLVTPSSVEHFDHIVPLALGGLNDVSNLQLLCAPCNMKKRDGVGHTSRTYAAWYDMKG